MNISCFSCFGCSSVGFIRLGWLVVFSMMIFCSGLILLSLVSSVVIIWLEMFELKF